jgi:hypothetical protein
MGGPDAGKFTIDASTGALSFIKAPNFELPTEAGGNNVYDVTGGHPILLRQFRGINRARINHLRNNSVGPFLGRWAFKRWRARPCARTQGYPK